MSGRRKMMVFVMLLISLATASTMAVAKKASKFKVDQPVYLAGTEIKSGEYAVTWESNSAKATVMFAIGGTTVAKAEAKVAEMEKASAYDTLIIGQDSSGRKAIKQIRFAKEKTSLVFE
jgi:hypothetical protein